MSQNDVCMICFEKTNTHILTSCGCKYFIHENCFQTWLNLYKTCIICKTKIYHTSNSFIINFKYLDRELSNSFILEFLEKIIQFITKISNYITNQSIKFILFNVVFAIIIFTILIPFLLIYIIISQTKYIKDRYFNNNIYGRGYQLINI